MNTCRNLFVYSVLLIVVAFISACGAQVTAAPTPVPTPVSTQVCAPSSQDGFGRSLTDWQIWDGAERTYETSGGSQFHLRFENELIIELTPANPDMVRTEMLRQEIAERYLAVIPMATNIEDRYYVVSGPIYIYRCGTTIWIDDEFKGEEIQIPIDQPSGPQG